MPTISVVIPTRDRPQFVREALRSLRAQEFSDFEVIVADNPLSTPCQEVVEEFDDRRFRYRRAERPLSMHDNWELGGDAANGDYVGVMTDRIVWLPSTMSHALGLLDETSSAVVSWWSSTFVPSDEQSDLGTGTYLPYCHPPSGPIVFSGRDELAESMRFSAHRGEGISYFRANICMGLYRRDVMEGIRDRVGRVFPPVCPDYTSRTAALATAPSFVDAGVPLQTSYSSRTSHLLRSEQDPVNTQAFLEDIDPGLPDRLPIPGLYASLHNVVAHDYLIAEELGAAELDRANVAVRARDDLAELGRWPDREVRREQYRLLTAAERKAGRSSATIYMGRANLRLRRQVAAARVVLLNLPYRVFARVPRLRRLLRTILRMPPVAPTAGPDTLAGAILAAEAEAARVGLGPARAPRAKPPAEIRT